MLDYDTFLTLLYVTIDDFCRTHLPAAPTKTGPPPSLNRSEVLTLALLGRWARFRSERDFWRFARRELNHLFLHLPHLSQFNRLEREHQEAMIAFSHFLVDEMDAKNCLFEVLDRCGIATRWCNRRGVGWLPEETDKGRCARLGYFHGFELLTASNPDGVITGFAVGAGSAKDQPLAEALFYARQQRLLQAPCVGLPARSGDYVTDVGFNGKDRHRAWLSYFAVRVIHSEKGYTRQWKKWLAGLRQIIESVHNALVNTFGLETERPHEMRGFFARLSARVALHNFCIWLNRKLGRPSLQFADLLAWH
jgi:hypothetical protein